MKITIIINEYAVTKLFNILFTVCNVLFSQGSPEVTVVIDGYIINSTQSSPASLPLGTALVLVCRVSGIPQRQIKYNWTCPDGLCERPEYVGRKVVNGNILEWRQMGDTAKAIPSMFQVNTRNNTFNDMHIKIYAHVKNIL